MEVSYTAYLVEMKILFGGVIRSLTEYTSYRYTVDIGEIRNMWISRGTIHGGYIDVWYVNRWNPTSEIWESDYQELRI